MPDIVGLEFHKPTSLQGIATKAAREPRHRFENLYGCLDEELLEASWRGLNKHAASGVDRVTAQEYAQDLESNLANLVERLKAKRYRARLVRRQYIPKANGKLRPLGIPALEDKIVQGAAAAVLQAIYEQDFYRSSFGYREGVGALDAVQALTFNLQYGPFGYGVEADIAGFFDHLAHDQLLEILRRRINDEAFLGLIRKWLKAGVLEPNGEVIHPITGSPQGGIVSPVLANVYLHRVLDQWVEEVVKPHCRGKALLCRYADDFVCAFQYRDDAERFFRVLPKRLAKFNLTLAAEKTRLLRFSRFHPGRQRRFAFLGFEFYWNIDRQGEARLMKRTDRKKLRGSLRAFSDWIKGHRHWPQRELFRQLKAKLRGYYNYYGVPGNSRGIGEFHRQAMKLLYKWLNRRSQRRGLNWPRFKRLLERFQVPGPRIRPYTKEHPILSARLPRLLREASTIEEPGAGNLHAGICAGAAG